MKKAILLLTAVIVAHTGFAQVSIDPEIGMNIAKMPTKYGSTTPFSAKTKSGIHLGAGLRFNLYKGFYVKPGIYYNMFGGEINVLGVTSTTTLNYINIPVDLGYNYIISNKIGSIFLEAGPQVGYALSGYTKVKPFFGSEIKNDLSFGDKTTENNPFDWGFNFGLGYATPWGVYLKGSYGLGMGNLSNQKNIEIKNDFWNVSLGYKVKL